MSEESKISILLKRVTTEAELRNLLDSELSSDCSKKCICCGNEIAANSDLIHEVEHSLSPGSSVTLLECRNCDKYGALRCNGTWHNIEDALHLPDYSLTEFSLVKSPVDHLILYLLSQVCHNQWDIDESSGESPFLPPNLSDQCKLMWKDNHAVGFYSIKRKGSAFPGYPLCRYNLNVIDTIYVRRQWRHQGLASRAITEVLSQFPNENLGFSDPVSNSLLQVLYRYLSSHPNMRDRMWVCSFTGEPAYRWNVYLHMKTEQRKEKKNLRAETAFYDQTA